MTSNSHKSDPEFRLPRVQDGFLNARRCERILEELEFSYWQRSTVIRHGKLGDNAQTSMLSPNRTSETSEETWFSAPLNRELRRIGTRVERIIPDFEARRERWQATRYCIGEKFDFHYDCGIDHIEPGERKFTLIIYLTTNRFGGDTFFIIPDFVIAPLAGRLVIWNNLLENGQRNSESLHASLPVLRGQKVVLVTWVNGRSQTR